MTRKMKCFYWLAIVLCICAICFIFASCIWQIEAEKLKGEPAYGVKKDSNIISYQGKQYKYNNQLINALLLGVDKKGTLEDAHERGGVGQTDAVFLVSIDTKEKRVKVFCIPRDSMVPVKRTDSNGDYYDTQVMQLSLQYAFGDGGSKSSEMTAQAVEDLMYQVPFSGYYAVDLEAVRILNDAVGGVDVLVDDDFTWYTQAFPTGSTVHLKGDQVMEYLQVRNTNEFATSMSRLERQQGYMDAFMPTLKKALLKDPTLLLRTMKRMKPYMVTDFNVKTSAYLAVTGLKSTENQIEFITLPGEVVQGDRYEEYHVDDKALYKLILQEFYLELDKESLTSGN